MTNYRASLRCSIVRERFGRVKISLRRYAVLTRPARSRGIGNYRSDPVDDRLLTVRFRRF